MSEQQRKKVLCQFMSLKPVPTAIPSCLPDDSISAAAELESVREESCNPILRLSVAPYVAETIWKNANDLIQEEANFVSAPGKVSQSWFVAQSNTSTAKPYFVRLEKGHHYQCENDCFYFQTCKVCPHIIALAHRNGNLDEFISWHMGQKYSINTTTVAESGLPKGSIGKKTAQRKGVSKKKSAKIRKVCENSLWQSRAATPAVSKAHDQLQGTATAQCISRQDHTLPAAQLQTLPSTCSPSSSSHQLPAAIQPQMSPFMLTFVRGNISVCFGCKQRYRKPVSPPHDLCVMHHEWRTFTIPNSPSPQSRFGNAYYHPNLPCIQSIWPLFNPQHHLVITGDVSAALLPSHRHVLRTLLGLVGI